MDVDVDRRLVPRVTGLPQQGRAEVRWLGQGFVELEAELEGQPVWHFVFGRSDPDEQLVALYNDPRRTSRVFRMTFGGGEWKLVREDPDFHQRFVARIMLDRIDGRWEASEDQGTTWRKDFDLHLRAAATIRLVVAKRRAGEATSSAAVWDRLASAIQLATVDRSGPAPS